MFWEKGDDFHRCFLNYSCEQVGDVALISMDDGKVNACGPPMIAVVNVRLDRAADDAAFWMR